jgi:cytochrome c oxidase accessory protein FixG
MSAPNDNTPAVLDSPEAVLSTLGNDGKRNWIYPVPSNGKLWKARLVVAWLLVALFVALPIIKVGGKPAVFLDVMNREFTFFGLTLYPTDTLITMFGTLALFLTIALVTAVFGRVWCGWACPQTVYLEFFFRPVERMIEGKESKRRKRDAGPMTSEKFFRKALKLVIFGIMSMALAHVFVAYFVSWERLLSWMTGPPTDHWGVFVLMAGTSALILFDFGYFREQMCTITCPYARFQSVLQDRDSMIVSYDPARGEARGRRNRAQRQAEAEGADIGLGDCIDCGACVRTCPTGIDIREGLQMECIGCTQCIDACDDIMESIGKPGGLIRYTSENTIDQLLLEKGQEPMGKNPQEPRVLRPRLVIYTVLFLVFASVSATLLVTRTPVEVDVLRITGAPFQMVGDDRAANRLKFVIQNRSGEDAEYQIKATSPAGTEVKFGGGTVKVEAGESQKAEAFVVAPVEAFEFGHAEATFEVSPVNPGADPHVEKETFHLLGPE